MRWETSDVVVLIITIAISLNLLITVIALLRSTLEQSMDMRQLSIFFKIAIGFSFFVMPILAGVILYKSVYGERIYLVSDDIPYLETIYKETFSYTLFKGNHWIFLLIFLAWFFGIIYFGIYRDTKYRVLLKKLEKRSVYVQDTQVMKIKEKIMKELNLKDPIILLSNSMISSPFTAGIVRRKIFLPKSNHTSEEWELLLKHELVHCKHYDYFFRRLIFLLCTLQWFNPFIYKLTDYFIEINEMACDEIVLYGESANKRVLYANLILQIQEKRIGLATVSLTGYTVNGLERRIRNIMKQTKKIKQLSLAVLVMVMILSGTFTAFASSRGVLELQDLVVKRFFITEIKLQQEPLKLSEKVEMCQEEINTESLMQMNARGATEIDVTVDGKKVKYGITLSLEPGDEVAFILRSDNSSDSFKAGLQDANNRRTYVETSEGRIDYTFSIKQSGKYKVFFENTLSQSIHIVGSVTVLKN